MRRTQKKNVMAISAVRTPVLTGVRGGGEVVTEKLGSDHLTRRVKP